jgi:hypothetical protein
MNNYALLFLALMLCGCDTIGQRFVKREAIPENCDPQCRQSCVLSPDIKFAEPAGPYNAGDEITKQVVAPLIGAFKQCDLQRQACTMCLDRLKEAGLTK